MARRIFALAAALALLLCACGTPAPIPNPPLVLGEKHLTDLDYEQALLQFDQAIHIEPKNPRGYLGKADALLHLGRQANAADTLAAAARATRGEPRAALKDAQAAVEKSPVDGYIGLATAYQQLGWRDIALALLRRVCEELPEESRLREALEGLVEVINNITATENRGAKREEIPDNVFTFEDAKQFGITWDSDPYEVADKFGIARRWVDKALGESIGEFGLFFVPEEYGLHPMYLMFGNKGFMGVRFEKGYSGPALPHNIHAGMNVKQVFESFYYTEEKALASIQMVENRVVLYEFFDSEVNCHYYAVIEGGTMNYSIIDYEKGTIGIVVYYNPQDMKVSCIDIDASKPDSHA